MSMIWTTGSKCFMAGYLTGFARLAWQSPFGAILNYGRTDVFSDEIFTQLQQSVLFMPIVSPSWNESPWCQDERQAFERFAALNGGLCFENTSRAIKVVKTPLSADQHHDMFGTTGFEFYKRETQSVDFDEFDQTGPEFRRTLDKLAQEIKRVLDAFRQRKIAQPKDTVYVATTTSDLKQSRDRIVQELEQLDYAILPQVSELPHRLASFQSMAKAELTACMFSVHMVSDQPKPILEGEHDSITEQYRIAQSLRKYRIVWIEPKRQLYSDFDDALKSGLQNRLVDVLRDRTIEGLKEVIVDKLDPRGNPPASIRKSRAGVEPSLFRNRRDPSSDSNRKLALSASENRNPFQGLRSFEREQAPLFFGRDEQIRDLLGRLEMHRFLPIVGVSGSGKSSLVRAGLIPALTGSYVSTGANRMAHCCAQTWPQPDARIGVGAMSRVRCFRI